MSRARLFAAFLLAILIVSEPAFAQRGNDFDSLLAQMNAATQGGRWAEGLAAAQKLETLVRRRQGADVMNYAGVLHNEGMFLHNLGRYGELFAYDAGTHHKDIHIVVFHALMARVGVVADSRANSDELVGRHARPDPAAANEHSALGAAI